MAEGDHKRRTQYKTGCYGWCPRRAVYFPKYVCINNPKLALVYWSLVGCMIVFVVYNFFANKQYNMTRVPTGKVSLWMQTWQNRTAHRLAVERGRQSERFCTHPQEFNYIAGARRYEGWHCAEICSRHVQNRDLTCLQPSELVTIDGPSAFIATSFLDELWLPSSNQPRTGSYFVSGAEDVRLEFAHEFTVVPPGAYLPFLKSNDKHGHSMALTTQGVGSEEPGMITVFLGRDGFELKRFLPGELIWFTVREILGNATGDANDMFSDTLDLDSRYTRNDVGVISNESPPNSIEGPTLRTTGLGITFDLWYTNTGACDPTSSSQTVAWEGPVCCIKLTGQRQWTTRLSSDVLGTDGASRQRETRGISVKFRTLGAFTFLDLNAVFRQLTIAIIWIQFPLFVVYWFSILFLGHLSSVYSRVIHQDLSLAEACKGLAARLVSHSAAFMDLKDRNHEGISKQRLLERFKKILDHPDLDDDEISKFVDFVFEGMKSMVRGTDNLDDEHINVQEYCTACSTNEPLNFDALVKIFDKDRRMWCCENLFLDNSIVEVHRAEAEESGEVEEEQVDPATEAGYDQAQAMMAEMRALREKLSDIEDEVEKLKGENDQALQKERKVVRQVEDLKRELEQKEALKDGKDVANDLPSSEGPGSVVVTSLNISSEIT